jgi:hypothetical protein
MGEDIVILLFVQSVDSPSEHVPLGVPSVTTGSGVWCTMRCRATSTVGRSSYTCFMSIAPLCLAVRNCKIFATEGIFFNGP